MPRPSRKQQILDAALACFAERGYEGTRLKTIAERAEVSEAALYRHFASVEELGAELYVTYFTLYAERLAIVIAHEKEPEQQLRAIVRESLRLYRELPHAFLFSLQSLPMFLKRLPQGFDYPLQQIERVIRSGQKSRSIREGQSNVLAAIFLGAFLRPIELTTLASAGALDLSRESPLDRVIEDAAVAALVVAA